MGKNHYFTKEHQDAIVEYVKTDSYDRKNELYENFIEPVFDQLVDKIVYTYKFTNLPNIDVMKQECKTWLTTILDKFDEDTGSKAFSYFSVCTRNWFIARTKKRSKKLSRESSYDDIPQHIEEEQLVVENQYGPMRERQEFMWYLEEDIESWDKGRRGRLLGRNDKKVIDALRILLDNAEDLEILTKKAIYMHMRDITGLNTKQITRSFKKLKERYKKFKKAWEEGEIEEYHEFNKQE